jgi:hypothetical protein
MTAVRVAAVTGLVAAAAVLVLFAHDVLAWQHGVRSGDREVVRSPATAVWSASTVLPGDPVRGVLGLGTALRFRAAEQGFAAVQAAGQGYDNGLSEARTRGEVEAELALLGESGDHTIASAADNLLGILAFADAMGGGPAAPAPVGQ